MTADTRYFVRVGLAAGVVALMLSVPVHAQSSGDESALAAPQFALDAPQGSQTPAPISPAQSPDTTSSSWALTAGFEADTHGTGYAYIGPTYYRPIHPKVSLVFGGDVNYLYYQFPAGTGNTVVHSPGVALRGGVKIGGENYVEFSAGPSVKWQHTELRDASNNVIQSSDDTLFGADLDAEVWVDPTKHNNIYGIFDYSTQDQYLWSRLAYKEQLGNRSWNGKFTPYLGIEGVVQGNQDVRSTQFGPFFELVHVPSRTSIMFRGGWKRSTYQVGPDKTGPWFAIGYWHRL